MGSGRTPPWDAHHRAYEEVPTALGRDLYIAHHRVSKEANERIDTALNLWLHTASVRRFRLFHEFLETFQHQLKTLIAGREELADPLMVSFHGQGGFVWKMEDGGVLIDNLTRC